MKYDEFESAASIKVFLIPNPESFSSCILIRQLFLKFQSVRLDPNFNFLKPF